MLQNRCQASIYWRLATVRVLLGVAVFLIATFEFDNCLFAIEALDRSDFYAQFASNIAKALRILVMLLALTVVFFGTRWAIFSLLASYSVLSCNLASLTPGIFNYNTHLFWLLLLILSSDSACLLSYRPQKRRFSHIHNGVALQVMCSALAMIYLLSMVAKFASAGPEWFTSGRAVAFALAQANSPIATWLRAHEWTPRLIAMLTGVFEWGFPIAVHVRRLRVLAVVSSLCFHLGIWFTLGISFWHLWLFFPALYISPPRRLALVLKLIYKKRRQRILSNDLAIRQSYEVIKSS